MSVSDDMFEELELFVEAQDAVWPDVVRELGEGRKTGHWMWFVFPQIDGLGSSPAAVLFALDGPDEAAALMSHPVLGLRLRQAVGLVLEHRDTEPDAIFGTLDAKKFRSCLTLFQIAVPDEPIFGEALDAFYGGDPDPKTIELLNS